MKRWANANVLGRAGNVRKNHRRWDIVTASAFLSPRPAWPSPHQSLLREGRMGIDVSTVAAALPPHVTTAPASADFEQRWAAWQAKGAAHDRAVRQKVAVVTPILIIVAAVISYALLGR